MKLCSWASTRSGQKTLGYVDGRLVAHQVLPWNAIALYGQHRVKDTHSVIPNPFRP